MDCRGVSLLNQDDQHTRKLTWPRIAPTEAAERTVQQCGRYHVAKAGETRAHLSIKYGITVDKVEGKSAVALA